MFKNITATLLILIAVSSFSFAFNVPSLKADSEIRQNIIGDSYKQATNAAGYTSANPKREGQLARTIGGVIRTILGLLGILFMILIFYGGFLWMTASGNDEQLGRAKKMIINATIGVVIVVAAYSITWFVMEKVIKVTTDPSFLVN